MITYKQYLLFSLTALALSPVVPCVHADVVELTHGDRLSGTVTAMNEKGITIVSPLTSAPLEIKSKNINDISFDNPKSKQQKHSEFITLSNGDTLPCEILSLNKEALKISTWFAGTFKVPRQDIKSLQFGISENELIYAGTDDPSEWGTREGTWTLSKKGYSSQGNGVLARKLKLPQNLSIKFDLSWDNTPNVGIRFCAENTKSSTKQDCYEFTYGSSGLRLRRVLKESTPAALFNINLKPHEIDHQQMKIELQINRDLGKITLLIDGKKRGSWLDTFEATTGNYIVLSNKTTQGTGCYIGNLSVNRWVDGSHSKQVKDLAQGDHDVMIDDQDERITGEIILITEKSKQQRSLKLQTKYDTNPVIVPTRRIHTLVFAAPDEPKKYPNTHYIARIVGGGKIQLANPQLDHGKITTHHPILGSYTIDTSAISSIEIKKD